MIERLFVGVAVHGDFKALTTLCLVKAVAGSPVPVMFDIVQYTHVNLARERLADAAIRNGASHMLMVDADMVFPTNIIELLGRHGKDIVGANYNMRRLGPDGGRIPTVIPLGEGVPQEPFQCEAVATGCLLVDLKALERVPRPWFFMTAGEGGDIQEGGDYHFCRKAREHGLEVWCDPTIEVGHVGDFVY